MDIDDFFGNNRNISVKKIIINEEHFDCGCPMRLFSTKYFIDIKGNVTIKNKEIEDPFNRKKSKIIDETHRNAKINSFKVQEAGFAVLDLLHRASDAGIIIDDSSCSIKIIFNNNFLTVEADRSVSDGENSISDIIFDLLALVDYDA